MPKADPLKNLRDICLSLPDTKETVTWGKPHFRVGEKIFCGYGEDKGVPVIGFKLEMEYAWDIVKDPRFWRAPYVGHKGWVSMDALKIRDWDEVRHARGSAVTGLMTSRTREILFAGNPPREA